MNVIWKVRPSQHLWIQIVPCQCSTTGNKVCRKYFCEWPRLSRRLDSNEHVWAEREEAPFWSRLYPRLARCSSPQLHRHPQMHLNWVSDAAFSHFQTSVFTAGLSVWRRREGLGRVVWTNGEGGGCEQNENDPGRQNLITQRLCHYFITVFSTTLWWQTGEAFHRAEEQRQVLHEGSFNMREWAYLKQTSFAALQQGGGIQLL